MKILTFVVPCYNSEAYMGKCIESLLPGGEEVEILIVDDGSKDRTAEIADAYQEKYPTIIRAIHQENKGPGGAINTGLAHARGLYFKVVDSDDWVNEEAYRHILNILEDAVQGSQAPGMLICNYVYEKEGSKRKRVMRYHRGLPPNHLFSWEETKKLGRTQSILMHSLVFRTQLLQECNLQLPEHMFYVDNLVAFIPYPYVTTMYYADVNFYRYYIGRPDQTVNEQIMITHIDQQLRVNKIMIDYLGEQKNLDKHIRNYMVNYLTIIMMVSSVMLIRSGTPENLEKKMELWKYLKANDSMDYRRIRYGLFGIVMCTRTKAGQKIAVYGYKIAQKLYGFN